MKYIGEKDTIETQETNEVGYIVRLDGFDQLIEARNNGEFGVWEYGGYITTTDDVPDNYELMEHSEVTRIMKIKAIKRKEKLDALKSKSTGMKL